MNHKPLTPAAHTTKLKRLPWQTDPCLLTTASGDDAIAYLNVRAGVADETRGPFVVQADVSGRHYRRDREVVDALRRLQARVGGVVRNDDDAVIA